jgi:hypothetical protein
MGAKLVKQTSKRSRAKKRRPLLADQPYDISEGITQSMLATWTHCRQNCHYYLDGWRPEGSTEALEYGTLFHFLLEHVYSAVRAGEITSAKQAIAAFEKLVKRYVKKHKNRIVGTSLDLPKFELMLTQAEGTWPGYCRMWKNDFTRAVKWRELESVFDVEFHGFRLRGMMDGLREVKKQLQLLENKTKGRWNQDSLDRKLGFDFQNQYYLLAANLSLATRGVDRTLDTVLYNVIRRPEIKPDKSGSLGKYLKRLREDVASRPNFYFVRREAFYGKKRRAEFEKQLLAKLMGFTRWIAGKELTYRNEEACIGRYTCKYLECCGAGDGRMRRCKRNGRLFEELEE